MLTFFPNGRNPDPVTTRTTALTEQASEVKLLYGAFHDEDSFKPLPLLIAIRSQYHLRWDGIHGIGHWERVWRIGEALAEQAGADRSVVRAFAFLHDACRLLDSTDPDHGRRGGKLARKLNRDCLGLAPDQMELLVTACSLHTCGGVSDDPTIGTCWDADRLDLARFGIVPDLELLSTAAARNPAFIVWAKGLSVTSER